MGVDLEIEVDSMVLGINLQNFQKIHTQFHINKEFHNGILSSQP